MAETALAKLIKDSLAPAVVETIRKMGGLAEDGTLRLDVVKLSKAADTPFPKDPEGKEYSAAWLGIINAHLTFGDAGFTVPVTVKNLKTGGVRCFASVDTKRKVPDARGRLYRNNYLLPLDAGEYREAWNALLQFLPKYLAAAGLV